MAATQSAQLQAISDSFTNSPLFSSAKPIYDHVESFGKTFQPSTAIQVGDKLPAFQLKDANRLSVDSSDLLKQGPLLITFYRGSWCPYCNIAVQHLQRRLDEIKAKGVTLVAITPELPDLSLSSIEKNELKFPVLTDLHNEYARKLGIVYDQSAARPLHEKLGVDLKQRNDQDTWEVPIPATLLVDENGVVRNLYLDTDFRKRLEPGVALEWIEQLQQSK